MIDAGPHRDRRLIENIPQLDRGLRGFVHLEHHEPVGHRLDQIQHIIQGASQSVNVFSVDRRDEGLVQPPRDLVGESISDMLDVLDAAGLLHGIAKVFHHGLEHPAAFDHVVGRLPEQFEKRFLFRD